MADATSRLIRRRGGKWRPLRDGGFIAFRTQDFLKGPLDQIPATDAVDFEVTPVNDVVVFSHRDDTGKLVRMSGSVLRLRVLDEDLESGERVERDYFVDNMNLFFNTVPPETLVDDPHPPVTWLDEPAPAASTSSLSAATVAAMMLSATEAPAPAGNDGTTTAATTKTTRPTARKTTADVRPDQLRRIVATAREARTAYDVREGRRRQRGFEGIAESSSEAYRRMRDWRIAEKRGREARREEAKRQTTTTTAAKTAAAGSTTPAAAAAAEAGAGAGASEAGGTGGSGKVTVRELVARARAGKT